MAKQNLARGRNVPAPAPAKKPEAVLDVRTENDDFMDMLASDDFVVGRLSSGRAESKLDNGSTWDDIARVIRDASPEGYSAHGTVSRLLPSGVVVLSLRSGLHFGEGSKALKTAYNAVRNALTNDTKRGPELVIAKERLKVSSIDKSRAAILDGTIVEIGTEGAKSFPHSYLRIEVKPIDAENDVNEYDEA